MQTEKEYYQDKTILRLHSESTGEYPLPDYNGDVKKVLAVKPQVVPSGKFLGDDVVEYSGIVSYSVVYLDGENNITHADFTTDYDIAVRTSGEKYVDSDIETVISSYSVRLVGPRKFSAKCSLESNVHICERSVLEVGGDAFEGYEPEVSLANASILNSTFAKGEEREIAEEVLTLEGVIADEIEPLLCLAEPEVKSCTVTGGGAEIKGELCLSLLYRNAEGEIRKCEHTVGFNERVPSEELSSCDGVVATVNVLSAKATVNPTEDGVSVVVSVIIEPQVRGVKNTSVELITDSYVKERGCSNEYRDFGYTEHICTDTAEAQLDGKVSLSELSVDSMSDFVYVDAQARTDSCEVVGDSVKIIGEVRFNGIAHGTDGENTSMYAPVKVSLPFEEYVNISCQKHDNARAFCSVSVFDEKMEIDSDNLSLSASLGIRVTLYSERKQRCLGASYVTDEEYSSDPSVVTVYYPDAGESIFGIAKKFHTSVVKIAQDNSLSESVFASAHSPASALGVKKLIIK